MPEDEIAQLESDKNFVAPEMGGEKEQEKSQERTKEAEIKANVEFWKSFGVEVDEADVRKEIEAIPEVKGHDGYLYVPGGINGSWILEKLNGVLSNTNIGLDTHFDPIRLVYPEKSRLNRRTTHRPYAFSFRYQQEPEDVDQYIVKKSKKYDQPQVRSFPDFLIEDDGSDVLIGRFASEERFRYMKMLEYCLLDLRFHKETGSFLDEKDDTITWEPQESASYNPCMGVKHDNGMSGKKGYIFLHSVNYPRIGKDPKIGVRRVSYSRINESDAFRHD